MIVQASRATDKISQVFVDKNLIEHPRVAATTHSRHYQMLRPWWPYVFDAGDNSETITYAYC